MKAFHRGGWKEILTSIKLITSSFILLIGFTTCDIGKPESALGYEGVISTQNSNPSAQVVARETPLSSPAPVSTPEPHITQVSVADQMVMVYIPAGEFTMGVKDGFDNSPEHLVFLDGYWIDQTEVTNMMYAVCVQSGNCHYSVRSGDVETHYTDPKYSDHPVVYVTWQDALDYCQWAGKRLPTEAEWEKAARGTDGRSYPWGEATPTKGKLNFNNFINDTTPVGIYPEGASPYGVLDMAGNVREWVSDWYRVGYYKNSPAQNPLGPSSGVGRVLRGGSFKDSYHGVRTTVRFHHDPTSPGINRGFRCASGTRLGEKNEEIDLDTTMFHPSVLEDIFSMINPFRLTSFLAMFSMLF